MFWKRKQVEQLVVEKARYFTVWVTDAEGRTEHHYEVSDCTYTMQGLRLLWMDGSEAFYPWHCVHLVQVEEQGTWGADRNIATDL